MMTRFIFTAIFVCFTLAGFSQDATIPAPIQVSKDSKLIIHTYAKGVQIYVCRQDTKDSSKYVWAFKEPRAVLYADNTYQKAVGKHYFNAANAPTWESTDGSKVIGAKLQQVNSPDSNAIPWLLLKTSATDGNGLLKSTTFIQRIFTKGGKAPANAGKSQLGKSVEVAYTAEYLFYSEK